MQRALVRRDLFASKVRWMRSTPTASVSIKLKLLLCLAKTGVKTAVTQRVTFILNAP
jgi:hypothetical protein